MQHLRLFSSVYSHVLSEASLLRKLVSTFLTFKWFFSTVRSNVSFQDTDRGETFVALFTLIWAAYFMRQLVFLKSVVWSKCFVAAILPDVEEYWWDMLTHHVLAQCRVRLKRRFTFVTTEISLPPHCILSLNLLMILFGVAPRYFLTKIKFFRNHFPNLMKDDVTAD